MRDLHALLSVGLRGSGQGVHIEGFWEMLPENVDSGVADDEASGGDARMDDIEALDPLSTAKPSTTEL